MDFDAPSPPPTVPGPDARGRPGDRHGGGPEAVCLRGPAPDLPGRPSTKTVPRTMSSAPGADENSTGAVHVTCCLYSWSSTEQSGA